MLLPAYIPSPSRGVIHIPVRAYGVIIALGVYAAVTVSMRRYRHRGGDPDLIITIAFWAVPAGLIGARIYHVITDYQLYTHDWLGALRIWDGGLGIWGGVLGGTLVGVYVARRQGADVARLMDIVAPAIPLAQAIGRYGNWFNQELFGRPTGLPWAVHIDLAHRPAGYAQFSTFQPTFLYESLWDLAVVGIVVLVERRVRMKPGRLFAVYVAAYTFGRFWVETMRIDSAHRFLGLRLNDWTSIIVFAVAMFFVITGRDTTPVTDTSVADVDTAAEAEEAGDSEAKRELVNAPAGAQTSSGDGSAAADLQAAIAADRDRLSEPEPGSSPPATLPPSTSTAESTPAHAQAKPTAESTPAPAESTSADRPASASAPAEPEARSGSAQLAAGASEPIGDGGSPVGTAASGPVAALAVPSSTETPEPASVTPPTATASPPEAPSGDPVAVPSDAATSTTTDTSVDPASAAPDPEDATPPAAGPDGGDAGAEPMSGNAEPSSGATEDTAPRPPANGAADTVPTKHGGGN